MLVSLLDKVLWSTLPRLVSLIWDRDQEKDERKWRVDEESNSLRKERSRTLHHRSFDDVEKDVRRLKPAVHTSLRWVILIMNQDNMTKVDFHCLLLDSVYLSKYSTDLSNLQSGVLWVCRLWLELSRILQGARLLFVVKFKISAPVDFRRRQKWPRLRKASVEA